jgi:hypothetical protein
MSAANVGWFFSNERLFAAPPNGFPALFGQVVLMDKKKREQSSRQTTKKDVQNSETLPQTPLFRRASVY